ncbi:MAG: N-acetyltransferase [Desulfovibrionaceae bacterium]|nr:N-acetyltransferase [Desulfovibrionaceae bacterium]
MTDNPLPVRPETAADFPAVRELVTAAFGRADEARLVERLRACEAYIPELALVATSADGKVVGHLMLTRLPIHLDRGGSAPALALAPVAVRPDRQRAGVGSALVSQALERAAGLGFGAVIVLGHPSYYPRFGFLPGGAFGVRCPFDVPGEAFMARELVPGALRECEGMVVYARAFMEEDAS